MKKLSPEELAILRKGDTEPPFTGSLLHNKERGTYHCAYCGNEIFKSSAKFDSGTGWPSFSDAVPDSLFIKPDFKLLMPRFEVVCAKCGSHLGHVFDDGPNPAGKRFCINSLALSFKKKA